MTEKGKRPGPSAYETRFTGKQDKDPPEEWWHIGEQDPKTGRWLDGPPRWYRPFGRRLPL